MPMNDAVRCENCHYCLPMKKNSKTQEEFGNQACVRYPPTPVPSIGENGESVWVAIMTPVNHNWWCGEWKPRNGATS